MRNDDSQLKLFFCGFIFLLFSLSNAWSCGGHGESPCQDCPYICAFPPWATNSEDCITGGGEVCGVKYCDSGRYIYNGNGKCYAYPTWCGGYGQEACTIDEQITWGVGACNSGYDDVNGTCYKIDGDGYPENCGGNGENACTINLQTWYGISACKSNLVENVSTGKCQSCGGEGELACGLSCDPGLWYNVADTRCYGRPSDCGRQDQRACLVTEFIPSCESEYVELNGSCRFIDTDGFPSHCGAHEEPACLVIEHIPSCKDKHIEFEGECLHCGAEGEDPCGLVCERDLLIDMETWKCEGRPDDCGENGERACKLWEFAPSCITGLVEFDGKCHMKADCGTLNSRPCTWMDEVFPSCRDGLYEDVFAMKCLELQDGEAAWWESFLAFTEDVSDLTPMCQDYLRQSADARGPFENMGLAQSCQNYFGVGFVCEAPSILGGFKAADAFIDTVIKAWSEPPCSNPWEELFSEATKHGKPDVIICPSGQFFDFIDGGSCWSCPPNYNRTAHAVNTNKACSFGKGTPGGIRELCAATKPMMDGATQGMMCFSQVLGLPDFATPSTPNTEAYNEACLMAGELTFSAVLTKKLGVAAKVNAGTRRGKVFQALKILKNGLAASTFLEQLIELEHCENYLYTTAEKDSIRKEQSVHSDERIISQVFPKLLMSNDRIQIFNLPQGSRVTVYDILGNKIHELTTVGTSWSIQSKDFMDGNYILKIQNYRTFSIQISGSEFIL